MARFPPRSSDSSKIILTSTGLKGDQGDGALYVVLQSPVVPVPVENDHSSPNYAGAISEVYIYEAGVLQTGWTIAFESALNCGGVVNLFVEPRTVQITSHSDETGYIVWKATKSGKPTLYFRLYFAEQRVGDDGAVGATGATGPTGPTGAIGTAGSDGTGLVVVHKTISVEAGTTVTKSDFGDGKLQLDFGAAHNLSTGDWVRVVQSGGVYDNKEPVVTVVDSDNIKLDIAYDATAGTVTAYKMENFQNINEYGTQFLAFNNIVPHGAKVLEFQMICSDDDSGALDSVSWRIGTTYSGDLDSVVGDWLNGDYLYQEGVVISRDKRSTIDMNIAGDYSLYMEALVGDFYWDSDLLNYELEFFLAYISYPITWTP